MIFKKISILILSIFILTFFACCFHVQAQEVTNSGDIVQIDDVIKIEIFGEKDLSGEYIVDKFGEISFPLIGNVKVEGLSLGQTKDFLEEKLRRFILKPQIISILRETQTSDLGLGVSHEIKVTVLGAVTKSGDYPKSPGMTLMQLIAAAGDFTKDADIHHVIILHSKEDGSKETINVDAGKILKGLAEDPLLDQNDLVSVKSQTEGDEIVTILGSVTRPGVYPINPDMTVMQLIASAGDLTKDADIHHVNILRVNNDGSKNILNADVEEILEGIAPDTTLNGNDIISVPENNQNNFVVLIGQVAKPGTYEYRQGLTLLGLIANAGDFTEMANKTRIKIIRKKGLKSEVIVVDIRRILSGKTTDVVLDPNDVVNVPESFF